MFEIKSVLSGEVDIKKVIIFVAVPLLMFFVAQRIFFFRHSFLEKAASYFVHPALYIANTVGGPIKKAAKNRYEYKNLLIRCKKLALERENILQENVQLRALIHYSEKSKELVEFQERYKLKDAILAKILVKNFTSEEHSMIVNRGSRDGIQENMVAIYKFQLLGKVKRVFPTYSKVVFITDTYSKVSAYTNTGDSRGIVHGTNQLNSCHLKYVSHLKTIHNGDFVLSSGQGLIFPEGFCLGKIINVKTNDLCHYVEVEPLIDFSNIEMCYLTNHSKMNLF